MAGNEIRYLWGDSDLLIHLGNRTDFRIRALYLIEFVVTGSLATLFLCTLSPLHANWVGTVVGLGAGALYLLAAMRFIGRIFFREHIRLDCSSLSLTRQTFMARHEKRFHWHQVRSLHYHGTTPKTDHPLKGQCYDYFGFDTQEQLAQTLHHPGNLYIETVDGRVYFATGVYSWHAEEIVQMMQLFAGPALALGPEWAAMRQVEEVD